MFVRKSLLSLVKSQSGIAIKNSIIFKLSFHNATPKFLTALDKAAKPYLSTSLEWERTAVIKESDIFRLGIGYHILTFPGFMAVLEITERQSKDKLSFENKTFDHNLYTFVWDRDKLLNLVRDCTVFYKEQPEIFTHGRRGIRNSLLNADFSKQEQFVNNDVYSNIDEIIKRMCGGNEWYKKRGKFFKETVLLYGPPGTGKSTLIRHFAAKYECDMHITTPAFIDGVNFDRKDNSRPAIIVLEEIDSQPELCVGEEDKASNTTFITSEEFNYGEFINWLDGIAPLNNVIVFMTTNFKDKLKKSVIRNGRVDRRIEVPYLTYDELIGYIGKQWTDVIKSFEIGRITVSMIPELREVQTKEEFIKLVEILSKE